MLLPHSQIALPVAVAAATLAVHCCTATCNSWHSWGCATAAANVAITMQLPHDGAGCSAVCVCLYAVHAKVQYVNVHCVRELSTHGHMQRKWNSQRGSHQQEQWTTHTLTTVREKRKIIDHKYGKNCDTHFVGHWQQSRAGRHFLSQVESRKIIRIVPSCRVAQLRT